MGKFNVERSREIRQWIGLGVSIISTAVAIDVIVSNGRRTNKIVNDLDKAFDNTKKVFTKSREDFEKKAKEEGCQMLHYSIAKWNEIGSRFTLLKKTYNDDGYYYASFNDTKYYIMIG